MEKTMEKIVALAKARGFVYPGSEIYGVSCQYLGLWKSGCGAEEQCKTCLVAEIYPGVPV